MIQKTEVEIVVRDKDGKIKSIERTATTEQIGKKKEE